MNNQLKREIFQNKLDNLNVHIESLLPYKNAGRSQEKPDVESPAEQLEFLYRFKDAIIKELNAIDN